MAADSFQMTRLFRKRLSLTVSMSTTHYISGVCLGLQARSPFYTLGQLGGQTERTAYSIVSCLSLYLTKDYVPRRDLGSDLLHTLHFHQVFSRLTHTQSPKPPIVRSSTLQSGFSRKFIVSNFLIYLCSRSRVSYRGYGPKMYESKRQTKELTTHAILAAYGSQFPNESE